MVNLFKYAGKRIKATFRSGDSLIGVLQYNKRSHYPYWFLGSSYTQGGLWMRGEERQADIVSVELIEETAMSNKVDLSKYVDKEIKATLRSGEELIGTVECDGENEHYPYGFLYRWYTEQGEWYKGSENHRDIIFIKLFEEAPMSNKVDLSKYVDKEIKATLRSGESREGLVGFDEYYSESYPYTFCGNTYTMDGHWFDDKECMSDIISISCEDNPQPEPAKAISCEDNPQPEPAKAISCEDNPQPEPAKAIYVALLDNQFICALPSKQDVKDYVKLKHPDVDPFDVIILTEAFKSES